MNAGEMLEKVGQTLGSTATVRAVFGEPIHAAGRTVVPVAKVAYGFGGGFGQGQGKAGESAAGDTSRHGEGGGGGGGVRAYPAGALEITESGTRFIPFFDARWALSAVAIGFSLGRLFSRRR